MTQPTEQSAQQSKTPRTDAEEFIINDGEMWDGGRHRRCNKGEKMKRYTVKELQDTIKAKDKMKRYMVKEFQETIKAKNRLIKDYEVWIKVLGEANNRKQKTITRQKARIKVLGAALVASQRDYEQLKRKRK